MNTVIILMVWVAIAFAVAELFKWFCMRDTPKSSHKPEGRYHCMDSCNACGGLNTVSITDGMEGNTFEAETCCEECGHKDYWAYGFFESGQNMVSKCRKYN